ncbi:MAG TPA: hypothetical protein VMR17_04880, partial [Xanthobacteraceae bacterium]|nr:hypothetical protein [Xanthobacteraceae bacterium]
RIDDWDTSSAPGTGSLPEIHSRTYLPQPIPEQNRVELSRYGSFAPPSSPFASGCAASPAIGGLGAKLKPQSLYFG